MNKFEILKSNPTLPGAIFDPKQLLKIFPVGSPCWVVTTDGNWRYGETSVVNAVIGLKNPKRSENEYNFVFRPKLKVETRDHEGNPSAWGDDCLIIEEIQIAVCKKEGDFFYDTTVNAVFRTPEEAELYIIQQHQTKKELHEYCDAIAKLRQKHGVYDTAMIPTVRG